MSPWADRFLGIIALATLVTAIVQVGVIIVAGLLVRRINRLANQVEHEMKPLFAHLNGIGRDVSRATSLAVAQVERADHLLADVAKKIEQTITAAQATIVAPAREGMALLDAFRAAIGVIRDRRRETSRVPHQRRGEDEDALFI